jgi:hypothetical protein
MALDILNSIDGRQVGEDVFGRLVARDLADVANDAKVIAKKLYSSVAASTAVSNTATETEFDANYTLPANILQAGSLLRVRYQGIQTAQNSTNTLGIKLYIGGKAGTALQTISAAQGAANNIFAGEFYLAVRTIGATGTFVGWGNYTAVPAASASATMVTGIAASTTIDTTATQKLAVAATWSAASASNSVRLDYFTVEML